MTPTTERRPRRPAIRLLPVADRPPAPGNDRLGEPRGLVGVYAARAAARDVDLRPIIAAHRADVDDVPNRAAARRGEDRPAVAAPVLLIGRGTSAHRAAPDRRGDRPTVLVPSLWSGGTLSVA